MTPPIAPPTTKLSDADTTLGGSTSTPGTHTSSQVPLAKSMYYSAISYMEESQDSHVTSYDDKTTLKYQEKVAQRDISSEVAGMRLIQAQFCIEEVLLTVSNNSELLTMWSH